MIYLTSEQYVANLKLGKPIEQWLSYTIHEDFTVLKWLRIEKQKTEDYSVAYFESIDEGIEDFFDVYEFPSVDPDEPYVITTFDSIEDSIGFAKVTYDAKTDRFVNGGMIQEEYRTYLKGKLSSITCKLYECQDEYYSF